MVVISDFVEKFLKEAAENEEDGKEYYLCIDNSCWVQGSSGGYIRRLKITYGKTYIGKTEGGYYCIVGDDGIEGLYPKSCFYNSKKQILLK